MPQREMPFFLAIDKPKWVEPEKVNAWRSWRDAVLWCWKERINGDGDNDGDQAMFRIYCAKYHRLRIHAPHMTRWVKPDTKAPMDLPVDCVEAFESFTGWRGVTQYFARSSKHTILEEVQERLRA